MQPQITRLAEFRSQHSTVFSPMAAAQRWPQLPVEYPNHTLQLLAMKNQAFLLMRQRVLPIRSMLLLAGGEPKTGEPWLALQLVQTREPGEDPYLRPHAVYSVGTDMRLAYRDHCMVPAPKLVSTSLNGNKLEKFLRGKDIL